MKPATRTQSPAQHVGGSLAALVQVRREARQLATLPSTLSNRELLLAALVVSTINGSPYHVRLLRREVRRQGFSRSLVDALIRYPYWPVSDDDRLDVVVLAAAWMAATPGGGRAADRPSRSVAGLADQDVAVLARVVGAVASLNHVAIELGLR